MNFQKSSAKVRNRKLGNPKMARLNLFLENATPNRARQIETEFAGALQEGLPEEEAAEFALDQLNLPELKVLAALEGGR